MIMAIVCIFLSLKLFMFLNQKYPAGQLHDFNDSEILKHCYF
jgi:hypothetical protein